MTGNSSLATQNYPLIGLYYSTSLLLEDYPIGLGLTIGYQWVSRRGFVVELFNGFGTMPTALSRYRRLESDGTVTTRLTNDYLKLDWRAGFGLGYAF